MINRDRAAQCMYNAGGENGTSFSPPRTNSRDYAHATNHQYYRGGKSYYKGIREPNIGLIYGQASVDGKTITRVKCADVC